MHYSPSVLPRHTDKMSNLQSFGEHIGRDNRVGSITFSTEEVDGAVRIRNEDTGIYKDLTLDEHPRDLISSGIPF
jgi:hypothetical protein